MSICDETRLQVNFLRLSRLSHDSYFCSACVSRLYCRPVHGRASFDHNLDLAGFYFAGRKLFTSAHNKQVLQALGTVQCAKLRGPWAIRESRWVAPGRARPHGERRGAGRAAQIAEEESDIGPGRGPGSGDGMGAVLLIPPPATTLHATVRHGPGRHGPS